MYLLIALILFQVPSRVYLVKSNMHTGIVIPVSAGIVEFIPAAEKFLDYKYIDIGWGDEDFYQHPDPDYLLGAKALLVPTASVIRIAGKEIPVNKIIKRCDFCIRFDLSEDEFKKLCGFINKSFLKDAEENFIIASKKENNRIVFYKSGLKYHLFNTCNTWIAEAFENCGYDISSSNVITAENLFEELSEFGTVLKQESKNN